MRDGDDDTMNLELARAVRLMRDGPEPSPAMRDALLGRLAVEPVPMRARTRLWTIRPWVALAAGLGCALIGASAYAVVSGSRPGAAPIAAATGQSTVRFTYVAPQADHVALAGDFNAWSPTSLPLTRAADGRTWIIEVLLPPGRYAYTFVVDGKLALDPVAPRTTGDDFGAPSSVVLVRGS